MTAEQQKIAIQIAISAWDIQNTRFIKLVEALPEGRMLDDIAPGKNSGIYLFGHLLAVSDNMLPLLGFGDRLFPELDEPFLRKPDKSGLEFPSMAELIEKFHTVNARLEAGFSTLSPEQWLNRHSAVSEEDFQKEPNRNKLNLLLNRTGHFAYHYGQVALLKP